MNLKRMMTIVLIIGAPAVAYAAPSINFVDRPGDPVTYQSVQCMAVHANDWYSRESKSHSAMLKYTGRAYSHGDLVASVDLKDLLLGAEGLYFVSCDAVNARTGENYTTDFEAFKVRSRQGISSASEYDENGFGYGIAIPPRRTLELCNRLRTQNSPLAQTCVNNIYGDKRYYIELRASGASSANHWYDISYSAHVSVYLRDSPRYLGH
ncbi:hypothetical protein LFL97_34005 [Burkholderia sp. JSH-S8]|nr:hypothetical protein LFL97_34005 [Burkholderia sp. JSH-S8]